MVGFAVTPTTPSSSSNFLRLVAGSCFSPPHLFSFSYITGLTSWRIFFITPLPVPWGFAGGGQACGMVYYPNSFFFCFRGGHPPATTSGRFSGFLLQLV